MLYEDRFAKTDALYTHLTHRCTQFVVESTKWCWAFSEWAIPKFYSLKAGKLAKNSMCKVHTSSHKMTNEPYVSSNYENTCTTKTVTADLTRSIMLRLPPHMLKKLTSLVKTVNTTLKVVQTANWIRILTEATWNSKVDWFD